MSNLKPDLRITAKLWRQFLYSRIVNIFTFKNLPEEINEQAFKLFLFFRGKVIFYKIEDKYVIQPFYYTDKLDWYYVASNGRVTNPWLPVNHQNWEFKLSDEAIIFNSTPDIYKFDMHSIVSDLVYKTANQLAENDISYYCIQRNHRLIAIFTAGNDIQKAEANRILEKIYDGCSDIVMQDDLVTHIQVNPIAMNSTRSSITELIEFQQYILANFYHSFGINSNYNLKREQLNSNEIDVNKDVLSLNINDMLRCRQEGVKKINDKYGLNIEVCLNEEVYNNLNEDISNMAQTGRPEDAPVKTNRDEGVQQLSEETHDVSEETSEVETEERNGGNKDTSEYEDAGDKSGAGEEKESQIETKDAEEVGTDNIEESGSEVQTTINIEVINGEVESNEKSNIERVED